MSVASRSARLSWLAAFLATAATYFYFLIFAEFAFLELARSAALEAGRLRGIMGALCVGGVAGAVLAMRVGELKRRAALSAGFAACAASALVALGATTFPLLVVAAAAIGVSLGWTTVTLAAGLRAAAGDAHLGLCIGSGTGLAYAACNIPAVFHAPAGVQTLAAAGVAAVAALLPFWMERAAAQPAATVEYDRPGLARWTLILAALVWMDSAAFYIIQHTEPLRAATWHEPAALWINALVHLLVAVVAGTLLDRRQRGRVALGAVVALAVAILVLDGFGSANVRPGWIYSAGVSAYSALFVEYPARSGRASVAAVVFAVGGWIGSALGIGMAQDLNRVPLAFVAAASAALFLTLAWRSRALRRVGLAALVAGAVIAPAKAGEVDLIARGREVYIAEGCIHCHSQYVRPRAPQEVEQWGPATVLSEGLAANPPLFGTRRQGPDLSHVGNRRSAEWNRLHLIAPGEISPGSRMPSYAHLFRGPSPGDTPGDALVAYLTSLGRETLPARLEQIAAWTPDRGAIATPEASRHRFEQLCAHCHGPAGRGNGPLAARLSIRPPDWAQPGWRRVAAGADVETALCRIIKFGLPGSPMAGHEYLPDRDVVGLARYVESLHSAAGGGPAVARRP